MDLKGEYRIPAPREQVWAMLNDPAVLRECIPGCESLEGSPAEGFSARVTTKIGPVKATFNGAVTLSNVNPPESYTISGEGKGGVAGFAKGGADVHLAEDGAGHDPDLRRQRAGRRQARPARLAPDRFDGEEARRAVLHLLRREGRRGGAAAAPILPGQPIPPAATGVPIVEGQAAAIETVPPVAAAHAAPATSAAAAAASHPHTLQEVAHEVEEEIEAKAAVGFLGGPIVWGLLVILALLFVYVVAT